MISVRPSATHPSVRPPLIRPSVRHSSVRPYPRFILTPSNRHNIDLSSLPCHINETRLHNSIPIQLITVQGYSWIYKHRNGSGGGVGFYLKDLINCRIRSDLNDPDIEILTIEIVKKM